MSQFQSFALLFLILAVPISVVLTFRRLGQIELLIRNLRATVREEVDVAELRLYHQLEALQALAALLRTTHPLPALREWAGSPDFLLELAREMRARRPETVVECSSGASTVVAARCCELNQTGHVYSLENSPEFAAKTRRMLESAGLHEWATVIVAPLESYSFEGRKYSWYSTADLGVESIDMLVVDGPLGKLNEQARYPAGPVLFPRMNEGGLVMLDDANRPDEHKIVERWLKEFPQLRPEKRDAEKGLVLLERARGLQPSDQPSRG